MRECLLSTHKEAHGQGDGDLSDLALTLFHHYVVNESGYCVENMISFLKECVLPLLTDAERHTLFKEMISQFLRVPKREISQKAVIQAISQLKVPSGDLIGYLGGVLGISDESGTIGEVSENPISILTAVFVLNMASMKSIEHVPI